MKNLGNHITGAVTALPASVLCDYVLQRGIGGEDLLTRINMRAKSWTRFSN